MVTLRSHASSGLHLPTVTSETSFPPMSPLTQLPQLPSAACRYAQGPSLPSGPSSGHPIATWFALHPSARPSSDLTLPYVSFSSITISSPNSIQCVCVYSVPCVLSNTVHWPGDQRTWVSDLPDGAQGPRTQEPQSVQSLTICERRDAPSPVLMKGISRILILVMSTRVLQYLIFMH